MLSRLHAERVFTGSHDVVFSESSAREAQRRLLGEPANGGNARKQLTRRQRQHQRVQNGAEQKQEDDDSDDGDSGSDGTSAGMSSSDGDDDEEDDDDEEEKLLRNSRHPPSSRYHPQHPYNAQLLALAKNPNNKKPVGGKLVRNGGSLKSRAIVYENHPMEFVFLPNGEIVPRDECPPGLVLPPPATRASIAVLENEQYRHLLAQNAFEISEGMQQQHQKQRQPEARKTVKVETNHRGPISASVSAPAQRQNTKISVVEYTKKDRPVRQSRSSSESSESSAESSSPRYPTTAAKRRNNNAEDPSANENSDSESSDGSEASGDDDEEEKENARQQAVRVTQKQRAQQKSSPKRAAPPIKSRSVAVPAPNSSSASKKQSTEVHARKDTKQSESLRAQPQVDDVEEQQQQQQQTSRRVKVPSQLNTREKHRKVPLPSPSSASDDSRAAWSRRPKAVKYEDLHSQQQHPNPPNAAEGRVKKSTKMDVRDLLSENSRVKVLKVKPSKDQSEKIEFLEQELQKEKKRVLEKMTQLLEEQGKNQQLQHQLDAFQSQLATKENEAEVKAKEVLQSKDASLGQVESQWKARVQALEDQLHVKNAAVLRLQSETEQLKSTVSKLKNRERQSSSQSHERESSANRQLEKIIAKLKKFRTRVESWQANSKEAMEVCGKKSDLLSLMDTLWLDFPAFPFLEDNKSNNGEKRDETANENANMLLFLKKRLRLREDELRQTHVKYVELKELCARQCVREADLQNFINEHRLRGNLIIRKDGSTPAEHANDGRKNVQFQEQQQQQRSEAKKRTIVSRTTNTLPTYYEEEGSEEGGRDFDEYDEDEGEHDEQDEEEQQEEYYVREPKVFVQVSRDGVYEHTPPRSSAVLRKLQEEQDRHARKKKEPREVERIRLAPSPTLARRYERVPAPSDEYVIAPARRKASSSNASTPPRSTANRLSRPPSISATRASGVVRRKSAQVPSAKSVQVPSAGRTNGTRTMSVPSRISRSTVPWV